MVSKVKEILNNDVEVVIASPQLSLSLLRCYSILFLDGGKPRICAVSQRSYYSKLKLKGMARAELIDKAKNRTCKPAWRGLRRSSIIHAHISDELINDEQAIKYLKDGVLKESDFVVLPEGYKVKADEEKPAPKKRGRKPKTEL